MTHPLRPSSSTKEGILDADEVARRLEAHLADQRLKKARRIEKARVARTTQDDQERSEIQDSPVLQDDNAPSRPKYTRSPSSCPIVNRLDLEQEEDITQPRIDANGGVFHPQRRRLDQDSFLRARRADQRRPLSMAYVDWEDSPDTDLMPAEGEAIPDRAERRPSLQDWTQRDEQKDARMGSFITRTRSLLRRKRQDDSATLKGAPLEQLTGTGVNAVRNRKHSLLGRFGKGE